MSASPRRFKRVRSPLNPNSFLSGAYLTLDGRFAIGLTGSAYGPGWAISSVDPRNADAKMLADAGFWIGGERIRTRREAFEVLTKLAYS